MREWLDFLWLELTRKCNLECIHCYSESSPTLPLRENLGADDWIGLIDEAAEHGCRKLQFIGGEPTLHPALPSLVRHASKRRFDLIEVYTNGIKLKHDLRQALLDCDAALAFSVYAGESRMHDSVTRRRGSLARTVDSLKWALACGLKVRVGVISMAVNRGAAAATRDFLQGLGVKSVEFDRERGVGRGMKGQSPPDPSAELCGRCWQGRLCITAQDQAYPCVFSRFHPLGSTRSGLAAILRGQALAEFRHMMQTKQAQSPRFAEDRSAQCAPLDDCNPFQPDCLPLGRPCAPDEFHPCLPQGGRRCGPLGGHCTPESPPCGPDGGCGPNAPPVRR